MFLHFQPGRANFAPFFMLNPNISRLKMEVQYCRDTSARLLHSNIKLFNIMKPKGQGKKEMLSTSEFSKNLKLYFGKVSDQQDQQVDTVDLFRKALKSEK